MQFGHYSRDPTVTIYTQRLVEGAFPATAVRNPAAPFGRSSAFTNPLTEGEKAHAEANELPDVDVVTQLGSSLRATAVSGLDFPTSASAASAAVAAAPGAQLALTQLFGKLKRRLGGTDAAIVAFVAALSEAADREAPGGVAGVDVTAQVVSADAFRAAVHGRKLAVTEREVEAVIAATSTASGSVSLGALLSQMS
jgi:hypothetical protein